MAKQPRVWTGTQWDTLAVTLPDLSNYSTTTQMNTAIGANAGLNLITSATIGSAVSSVTVSNCFSSTYDNYRIVLSNTNGTVNQAMRLSYNNSSGSTYSHVGIYWLYGSTGATNETGTGLTFTWVGNTHNGDISIVADIFNPFLAKATYSIGHSNGTDNPTIRFGKDTNAVSQTGFTITPASGTLTGGSIKVYGYRNS